MNSFKPWAALLFLPMFHAKSSSGVEEFLRGFASNDGKPVEFLELGEAFVARGDSIPISEIERALRVALSDLTMPERTLTAIHSAWLSNDLAALYETVSKLPMFAFPSLRDALLTQRNMAWSKKIKQLLNSEKKTLIVVGALHLCGPENLLDYLDHPVRALPADA